MAEVRVIARALAERGSEDELRALLQACWLLPAPNQDVICMNSTSQIRRGVSILRNMGKPSCARSTRSESSL